MATSTVENYLKAILQLEADTNKVTVGAIADELQVTSGTVSVMLKQLAEQNLVNYIPRRHVSLLPKGREQAMNVVRRHRLLECFLVEVMGLDWSEVHEEAEVLEHVISNRLLDRIDQMVGYPSHDPHGDPIPSAEGTFPTQNPSQSLAQAPAGNYRLVRVDDTDPDFLTWLSSNNLQPGINFTLDDTQRVAGLLSLALDSGETIPISLSASTKLYGEAIV